MNISKTKKLWTYFKNEPSRAACFGGFPASSIDLRNQLVPGIIVGSNSKRHKLTESPDLSPYKIDAFVVFFAQCSSRKKSDNRDLSVADQRAVLLMQIDLANIITK